MPAHHPSHALRPALLPLLLALPAAMLAACPPDDDDSGDDDSATQDGYEPGLVLPSTWDWCPGSETFVGAGDATLYVGPGAIWCATFNESRELEDELAAKAMVRLVEGSWPLPQAEGVSEYALPACAQVEEDHAGATTSGPGELDTAPDLGGSGNYRLLLDQPLEGPEQDPWQVTLWAQGPGEDLSEAGLVQLTGEHVGLATDPSRTVILQLCEWVCLDFGDGRLFDSCSFEGVTTERHRVEFDGGWIELDLRIGQSLLATQPGLFVGAHGELDGASFVQKDYWRLIYNPSHHHFSRDFAVLFDAPISGAAGLEIVQVDPWSEPPPTQVFLVGADLAEQQERAVTAETYTPIVQ